MKTNRTKRKLLTQKYIYQDKKKANRTRRKLQGQAENYKDKKNFKDNKKTTRPGQEENYQNKNKLPGQKGKLQEKLEPKENILVLNSNGKQP